MSLMSKQNIYILLQVLLIHFSLLRLMKTQSVSNASNFDFMRSRRVFEVNAEHPIIKNLDVSKSRGTLVLSSLDSC